MMSGRVDASLSSFFLFTPKNTQEGREFEKLLYYYPNATNIEEQTRYVGLSEALINFTSKFSEDEPCESVHFEKHLVVFYEPEPKYWMIMRVNNPRVSKETNSNNTSEVEYKENELDDIAMKIILKQSYRMFKILNGTLELNCKKYGENGLKDRLLRFYNEYLPTLKFNQADLFTTLDGIHFLPVDRNVYLRIQCFINLCENQFGCIKYCSFLYKDHLLWSGLEQDDIRVLLRFLINYVHTFLDITSSPENSTIDTNNASKFFKLNKVKDAFGFVTGPTSLDKDLILKIKSDDNSPSSENNSPQMTDSTTKNVLEIDLPNVFVGNNEDPYKLIIFQYGDIVCLFLTSIRNDSAKSGSQSDPKSSSISEISFYRHLQGFLSQQLSWIAPILQDHYIKKQSLEEPYRYIYFNHMNLALKTSIKDKSAILTRDILKILNDIHSDFEKSTDGVSELLIRTQNDRWVVGRKSDQREFYVIFDNKSSHLIEINEEVRKLASTYFNNIFID